MDSHDLEAAMELGLTTEKREYSCFFSRSGFWVRVLDSLNALFHHDRTELFSRMCGIVEDIVAVVLPSRELGAFRVTNH